MHRWRRGTDVLNNSRKGKQIAALVQNSSLRYSGGPIRGKLCSGNRGRHGLPAKDHL